ncbi:MAG: redoxin domain-containing protein [Gemmatimonadaceae bacterium]|nr:redoxin domain-containing protein [Gemmatimonadaceae bacterium]
MTLLSRRRAVSALAMACSVGAGQQPLAAQATDSTVISGTVRGADFRVPVRADVELVPVRNADRGVRAQAGADGAFRVSSGAPGPYRIRAAGVGYRGLERAIPVRGHATLSVTLTLAGLPSGLAKGPLVGVSTDADAARPRPDLPPAVLLVRGADGRNTGALTARRDTLAYRVVDITARTYLPPAGAPAFRWAEDGEYEGLLPATKGQDVRLVYDAKAVSIGGASAIHVTGDAPIARIVAQLDSIVGFEPASRCLIAALAPKPDPADARIADSSLTAQLQLVRRLLHADATCQQHPALGAAVLAQFTPSSPLWQLDDVMRRRTLLLAARQVAGQPGVNTPPAIAAVRDRFDAALAAQADTAARRDLLVAAAETFMPEDTVTAQRYAARLVAESYDDARVPPVLRLTGYNRVLQPGRMVPAFRLASMDSAGRTITNETLRGRAYLLDVWATWCRDCIVEIPALRSVHAKYRARGLRLLSVSVDEEQATADTYRREREPMPWMHAWAGAAPEGGPLAAFEVQWLPTTILVGRDGRILALAPQLESPEFAQLVERALR